LDYQDFKCNTKSFPITHARLIGPDDSAPVDGLMLLSRYHLILSTRVPWRFLVVFRAITPSLSALEGKFNMFTYKTLFPAFVLTVARRSVSTGLSYLGGKYSRP